MASSCLKNKKRKQNILKSKKEKRIKKINIEAECYKEIGDRKN